MLQYLRNNYRLYFKKRVQPIYQNEIADCGAACFAMVANCFGAGLSLPSVKARFDVSNHGVSLHGMMEMATHYKLLPRTLQFDFHELKDLQLPCILHWNMAHFVVLERVGKRSITVVDPAFGRRDYTLKQAILYVTGIALELKPALSFEPSKDRTIVRIRDIVLQNPSIIKYLLVSLLLSIVIQGAAIATPFFIQLTVDEVIGKQDIDFLNLIVMIYGLVFIFEIFANYLRAQTHVRMSAAIGYQLKLSVFARLLQLPVKFFETRSTGDLVSRFRMIDELRETLSQNAISVIVDGLMAILFLIIMYMISPLLSIITTLIFVAYMIGRSVAQGLLEKRQRKLIVTDARAEAAFIETTRLISNIKLFSSEARRLTGWANLYGHQTGEKMAVDSIMVGFETFLGILRKIETLTIVYLGAKMALNGDITIGLLFAYVMFKDQFLERMAQFVQQIINFRIMHISIQRIGDIVFAEPEAPKLLGYLSGSDSEVEGEIELKEVEIAYSTIDDPILSGVNLHCGPGQKLALVGPSGCGKTSVLKVILGHLKPREGQYLIDGIAFDKYSLRTLRSQVATVMQSDSLIAGSILDNVFFDDETRDRERAVNAAIKVGLHDEIQSMSLGYNTPISESGDGISAGQKQRILFARALYRDPKVLILDEPTSNLDAKSAGILTDLVHSLSCTVIAATHASSFQNSFDQHYRLGANDGMSA